MNFSAWGPPDQASKALGEVVHPGQRLGQLAVREKSTGGSAGPEWLPPIAMAWSGEPKMDPQSGLRVEGEREAAAVAEARRRGEGSGGLLPAPGRSRSGSLVLTPNSACPPSIIGSKPADGDKRLAPRHNAEALRSGGSTERS